MALGVEAGGLDIDDDGQETAEACGDALRRGGLVARLHQGSIRAL
jgi:hypothetical protein